MEVKRRRFQGVLNILSFNRHFYVYGLVTMALVMISHNLIGYPDSIFWIILLALIYGLIIPLVVSAYVYDFSGYYNFHWLKRHPLAADVRNIVNINAGFDETSFIIASKFPQSNLKVFDFYDSRRHTEPAIVRARKVSLVYPNTTQIHSNAIPLADQSTDIIFLLSAAHEIRDYQEQVIFLRECHRICRTDGKIIMVEHLRDLPNFLAFSVGFTHFFSKSTWKRAFLQAGFSTFEEAKFTPFMSVFTVTP